MIRISPPTSIKMPSPPPRTKPGIWCWPFPQRAAGPGGGRGGSAAHGRAAAGDLRAGAALCRGWAGLLPLGGRAAPGPRRLYIPSHPGGSGIFRADETLFALGAGESLWRWYRANRFCGRCGAVMVHGQTERSQICPVCGQVVYPKICPRHHRRGLRRRPAAPDPVPGPSLRPLCPGAGFNEIGESIEDTVRREVFEEVGLRVPGPAILQVPALGVHRFPADGFFARLTAPTPSPSRRTSSSEARWFPRAEIPDDHIGHQPHRRDDRVLRAPRRTPGVKREYSINNSRNALLSQPHGVK